MLLRSNYNIGFNALHRVACISIYIYILRVLMKLQGQTQTVIYKTNSELSTFFYISCSSSPTQSTWSKRWRFIWSKLLCVDIYIVSFLSCIFHLLFKIFKSKEYFILFGVNILLQATLVSQISPEDLRNQVYNSKWPLVIFTSLFLWKTIFLNSVLYAKIGCAI